MSDNMTINRLRFGFHRSDNRFQNSVPVLALDQSQKKLAFSPDLVCSTAPLCARPLSWQ